MASKRAVRRRSCEQKVKHQTKDFAKIALNIFVRYRRPIDFYHVYKCKFCSKYHIGRKKQFNDQ